MSVESRLYVTVHGDTVNRVLWRELQRVDDEIEALFWELNPEASSYGVIFGSGVVLHLPVVPTVQQVERVSVWD